uniref:ligase-associated DNA damage response DEXH box helicase n=1 Tax=Oleomonas cavernae TaxID=2320859 RepID=UPI0038D0DF3F
MSCQTLDGHRLRRGGLDGPRSSAAFPSLPPVFADWFAMRGWAPRPHQLAMVAAARAGKSSLLVAPTGGGKTLAGFLPSLIDLAATGGGKGLHTLYVSPLKALNVDVARNLLTPVEEMGLKLGIETRSGDTPAGKRQRQRVKPPDILLTTPEQVALLLAVPEAPILFRDLKRIVIDEAHAVWASKRGDLLALGLERLSALAPQAARVGLSATVADRKRLLAWVTGGAHVGAATIIEGVAGASPQVEILESGEHIPWSGHSARHAFAEILRLIEGAKTALVFVNTRAQAEFIFQGLWSLNEKTLPIALHHGSLAPEQRRKVEAAMVAGRLKGVVCTSTLDLGIDWGAVDLVIQVGAPKGASRMIQRIGRANHRLDESSRAVMVPANRFEVLECEAALEAIAEGALDPEPVRVGSLDVLAQHVLGVAVGGGFSADGLYDEIRRALPYATLDRATFDQVVDYVATGGYALKRYERYRRLRLADGVWRIAHPRIAQQYRLNVGTIVEAPMLKVRFGRGRVLGEIEEWFIEQLSPGDSFIFAGQILAFVGLRENDALVRKSTATEPQIPSYEGGKFPLSTFLAAKVRRLLARPRSWHKLPAPVREWLRLQKARSVMPPEDSLLVETFPRGGKHYMVAYCFEGRLAHQTLGMLLTRRMERAGLGPLGFVANDYSLAVWSLKDAGEADLDALFDQDMLGDDLDAWLAESNLMKRTFRNNAVIAGLIERRHPGETKSGRQVTFSSDLIYDVLRRYEPDHILLKATWADAATGLLDVRRLSDMLERVKGHIVHQALTRISPLAVPVMLEIGKEPVYGAATDLILAEAAEDLVREAMR